MRRSVEWPNRRCAWRAAAEQADVDLGQPERALLGRKQDVARGGDREPRPQRRAVQRADHGLGALADGVKALAHAAVVLPALAGRGEPGAALHVGAGREHLAGAREHGHAHVRAVAQGVEDVGHLGIELGVLGIDRRVVHGDDGDAVGDRELDECDVPPLRLPELHCERAMIAGSRSHAPAANEPRLHEMRQHRIGERACPRPAASRTRAAA